MHIYIYKYQYKYLYIYIYIYIYIFNAHEITCLIPSKTRCSVPYTSLVLQSGTQPGTSDGPTALQGYLAHKKTPHPPTTPLAP